MVRIVVIASFLIAAAACGGKSPPPKTSAEEAKTEPVTTAPAVAAADDFGAMAIGKMREFKGQVCACADEECLSNAEKALMDWAMKNMEELKEYKPTPEQDAEADKIEGELEACRERVTASSSSSSSSSSVTAAEILAKMEEFKTMVCACKDKACIEKVEAEMMEWAMKHIEAMKTMKPTKAQDEAADKIEAEMDACKEKVAGKP